MLIFPKIQTDKTVQVNDGLRLDATKTVYRDISEITDVQIDPENGFISVFESGNFDRWFLDWQYETEGEKVATVKVITETEEHETEVTINVITKEEDNLFSTDQDIIGSEPDILRYLPSGKTSFNYKHRESQTRIIAFLDENRIWKEDNERYTKDDIVNIEEFRHWSRFLTLHLIYRSKIVSPDDFFALKASEYGDLSKRAAGRATLRLPRNGSEEMIDRVSTIQVRR